MVELAATSAGNSRLKIGARHSYSFVCGQVEIKLFVQSNKVFLKGVLEPKLARNLWLYGTKRGLVFQCVADAEAFDSHMLLVNVRIHGRLAGHISGHVLNVVIGRDNHPAIWLDDADKAYLHLLVRDRIGEGEHCHCLYARVSQDAYTGSGFSRAGTVRIHPNAGDELVPNQGFLGDVRRLGCGRQRGRSGWVLGWLILCCRGESGAKTNS